MDDINEIQGIWLDRRNGKKVMVRDAIIDGDNMVITSSMGLIPVKTFSDYFVRMSETDYGTAGVLPEVATENINNEINKGIDDDMKIPTSTPVPSQNVSELNTIESNKIESENENKSKPKIDNNETESISGSMTKYDINNYAIIDKFFKKINIKPDIEFKLNTNNFPVDEINMLINVFDVSIDEISKYVINTLCLNSFKTDEIINNFSKYLTEKLNNKNMNEKQ